MTALRVLLVFVLSLFQVLSVTAQDSNALSPNIPVSGEITSSAGQFWTFQAAKDQPLSFRLAATSEGLDTAFRITDTAGATIIENDDYNYPDTTDSLLEAITLPYSGTYTLTVSGVGDGSGAYQLTMLEGFAELSANMNFNGDLVWQSLTPEVTLQASEGRLSLDLSGPARTGLAISPEQTPVKDYYASVMVDVGGQDGWIVGVTARQQADSYYLLQINNRGEWRFLLRQQDIDSIVQDWIAHPAIIPDASTFKLGILAYGSGFDFFYDDQLFGSIEDSTLQTPGQTGLAVSTVSSLIARTVARFDDLIITVPQLIDGQRILPQQLIITTPLPTARELQRRGLIPVGGDMLLTVRESFVESQRPGVEALLLGRGSTFVDFVLGARFTASSNASGMTGCGLVFRSQDDTNYILAYTDRAGGYGLARREGDTFQPGIFGEGLPEADVPHNLLIVARDEEIIYYVDGIYRGTLQAPPIEGAVGNAVVNFEPISTSCQFTNTWVWSWDS
jgi:hypothetical protein